METQETTSVTTTADVHPIPQDLDLEIKLEQEEEGGKTEELLQTQSAATALMLLSQPKREIHTTTFGTSLWEGIFLNLFSNPICAIRFSFYQS